MALMDPARLVNDLESEFDYPLLTRSVGTHTGATLQKSDTRTELLNALHQLHSQRDVYVSQYIDCRSDEGSFQKIRCFFVDGVPHPVCNIRSLHWEIRNRSRYLATSSNKEWIDEEAYSMEHFADYMGEDELHPVVIRFAAIGGYIIFHEARHHWTLRHNSGLTLRRTANCGRRHSSPFSASAALPSSITHKSQKQQSAADGEEVP
jgi:hypothetical protein